MSVRLVFRAGREVGAVNQGPWPLASPLFAAVSQVPQAGCWMVKESHRPSTPGASNPAGKTAAEEVIRRGLGSASKKHRGALEAPTWLGV